MSGGKGYDSFDATVDKTNRLLHDIEQEFGWPRTRRNQSYAALRAVLHALRDRLPVDESAQLAVQLRGRPAALRGRRADCRARRDDRPGGGYLDATRLPSPAR